MYLFNVQENPSALWPPPVSSMRLRPPLTPTRSAAVGTVTLIFPSAHANRDVSTSRPNSSRMLTLMYVRAVLCSTLLSGQHVAVDPSSSVVAARANRSTEWLFLSVVVQWVNQSDGLQVFVVGVICLSLTLYFSCTLVTKKGTLSICHFFHPDCSMWLWRILL